MHPLNQFIKGEYPELNNSDISLIIVGAVSIVFFNSEEVFQKIRDNLQEKGLVDALKSAVRKTEELKEIFVKFISSLNVSFHQMTNIISYAFIIPILPSIYEMTVNGSLSSGQIEGIVKRIISAMSITLSGVLIKELISKLINRFSGEEWFFFKKIDILEIKNYSFYY